MRVASWGGVVVKERKAGVNWRRMGVIVVGLSVRADLAGAKTWRRIVPTIVGELEWVLYWRRNMLSISSEALAMGLEILEIRVT